MAEIAFQHRLSAHCESGVTSALLSHAGVPVSEPMAFGIGSGLFFVHLPFDSLMGGPTTSFRGMPGSIFAKACKRLGVRWESRRFGDEEKAAAALAAKVDSGVPVGLQTSVYWLTYLPRRFRFQFNAHNIIVYGRREDGWCVSDPVLDVPVACPEDSLRRARFAEGMFAPKGRMYHVAGTTELTPELLRGAVLAGAGETAYRMLKIPIPMFGWKAIRLLSKRMAKWPSRFSEANDALVQLATVVRMQEEIGTGGAGFRYLFAAFLQEAGATLGLPEWSGWSERMTAVGDRWREFAARSAKIIKSGQADPVAFGEVAGIIADCAEKERQIFSEMYESLRSAKAAKAA